VRYRTIAIIAAAVAGLAMALPRRPARPRMSHADAIRRLGEAEFAFDETGSGAVSRIAVADTRLFAFRIDGRVRKQDVRAMARVLSAAFDAWDDIDILITMPDYEGIDLEALLDSEMAAAMVRSNRHVRRYAVIGPPSWEAGMIRMFDPLTPVNARPFSISEEKDAWEWVRRGRNNAAGGASAAAG
jgi:hypothetical protein